eukprot:9812289-Ditylum_brightwellii.AAC.1
MVDRVLKWQIKAAVDRKYLEALSEPLVGYMDISAMDMIDHLENNVKMNEPMDIDEPISTYFHCIEKFIQFAEDTKLPTLMNKCCNVWSMQQP